MFKHFQYGILLSGIILANNAVAACSDPQLTSAQISNTLPGSIVCVSNGAGGFENQEEHIGSAGSTGGDLYDYKKGVNDPIDPRELIGSWSINNSLITYNYTGGSNFTFSLHRTTTPGNYTFCGPATVEATIITNGGAGC